MIFKYTVLPTVLRHILASSGLKSTLQIVNAALQLKLEYANAQSAVYDHMHCTKRPRKQGA